jgi:hypothetical protein
MSSIRIGDRERERVADRLAAHAAAGRLTVDELEERVARAHAAVTERDLFVLEADLPVVGRRGRLRAPSGDEGSPRGAVVSRPADFASRPPALAFAVVVALLVAAFVVPIALVGHPFAPPLVFVALWFFVWRRRARRAFWAPSGW